jgi:hypothetical protein
MAQGQQLRGKSSIKVSYSATIDQKKRICMYKYCIRPRGNSDMCVATIIGTTAYAVAQPWPMAICHL